MSRFLIATLVAIFAAQFGQSAQASTVTYDLSLTNLTGVSTGTGTLIVDGPLTSGLDTLTSNGGGLDSLSITVNNTTFQLQNALATATAAFQDGSLTDLSYVGAEDGYQLDLLTTGLFYLYADGTNPSLASLGTISAVDPAPLPSTVVLFATGLLALGLLMYWPNLLLYRQTKPSFVPSEMSSRLKAT